jgi:CheY-like chemotaxis protein
MLYDWSNHTVLIAEDDEMNYKYLELIFSRFTNINIVWAINGQMAIEYCEIYSHIDLVIMDLQLPVIDGIEAARQIKMKNPEIYVLAHTANINSDVIEQCYMAGFDDFIPKPANLHDLLGRMDDILSSVPVKK